MPHFFHLLWHFYNSATFFGPGIIIYQLDFAMAKSSFLSLRSADLKIQTEDLKTVQFKIMNIAGEEIFSCSVFEVDLNNDISWLREQCKHPEVSLDRYVREYSKEKGVDETGKKFTIVRNDLVPLTGGYNEPLGDEKKLKTLPQVKDPAGGKIDIQLTLLKSRPKLSLSDNIDIEDKVQRWIGNEPGARDYIISEYGSIEQWDVSEVTDMSGLFMPKEENSSFNEDIGLWDVSKVEKMDSMFHFAKAFDRDISRWDTSRVKDMNYMFSGAVNFNNGGKPLTWDTSQVTDMAGMFQGAKNFNVDISKWRTEKVTNMSSMFKDAVKFNKNINTKLDGLFNQNINTKLDGLFNQNIHTKLDGPWLTWSTENVKDMENMFYGATDFDQELKDWNTGKVKDMRSMFKGTQIKKDKMISWRWDLKNVMGIDPRTMEGVAKLSNLL